MLLNPTPATLSGGLRVTSEEEKKCVTVFRITSIFSSYIEAARINNNFNILGNWQKQVGLMIIILRIHFWMILIDGAEQTDRAPHSAKVPECTKRVSKWKETFSFIQTLDGIINRKEDALLRVCAVHSSLLLLLLLTGAHSLLWGPGAPGKHTCFISPFLLLGMLAGFILK